MPQSEKVKSLLKQLAVALDDPHDFDDPDETLTPTVSESIKSFLDDAEFRQYTPADEDAEVALLAQEAGVDVGVFRTHLLHERIERKLSHHFAAGEIEPEEMETPPDAEEDDLDYDPSNDLGLG